MKGVHSVKKNLFPDFTGNSLENTCVGVTS